MSKDIDWALQGNIFQSIAHKNHDDSNKKVF